jgi:flagellar motility protein MotE (MotC chaperone)
VRKTKPKTRRSRRTGRGTVLMLVGLLMASGVLRLTATAGAALAADPPATPPATTQHEDDAADTLTALPEGEELGGLLAALKAREARVAERESQIELRRKALAVADEEIAKRMAALEKAEADLRNVLSLADGAAENDLANLTSVYESMKPKDAAALFGAMEPEFAAGFLGRMRPDAAAAVMAGLPPEAAYSISVILAGRNARAPKN